MKNAEQLSACHIPSADAPSDSPSCLVPSPSCLRAKRAFTLLEMILVVTILAIVTSSMISIIDDTDDQLRYDQTRTRLEQIKKALIGETQLVNGQVIVSGYIADTGERPTSLTDLVTKPTAIPTWAFDSTTGIGSGWRGPYINFSTDEARVNDAWGNEIIMNIDADKNMSLSSYASDGSPGGAKGTYEEDISHIKIHPHEYRPVQSDFTFQLQTVDGNLPAGVWSYEIKEDFNSPISPNTISSIPNNGIITFSRAMPLRREFSLTIKKDSAIYFTRKFVLKAQSSMSSHLVDIELY